MQRLFKKWINNPVSGLIPLIFILFIGVNASRRMSMDIFPNMNIPLINIVSHYPGASPGDIELLITRPIENEMRTIRGVKRVASVSGNGISRVTVEFQWSITVRDAQQLVVAKLSRLSGRLPEQVQPHLEDIGTTLEIVAGYMLYGGENLIKLRNMVKNVVYPRIMNVRGVSYMEILGGDEHAYNVHVSPETLTRFHLPLTDILKSIQKHNNFSAPGWIEESSRELMLHADNRIRNPGDILDIPIRAGGTEPLLLGTVARVTDGKIPRHYVIHGNTRPAVAIWIHKQHGASTPQVVRDADRVLSEISTLFPQGVRVKKFYDQSEIILESKNEIVYDLFLGAILAILIMYFFMGALRPTLIVAFTIPVTFLSTLIILQRIGYSLNVITMTALAISIGMIIDDAIVVSENIYRRFCISDKTPEEKIIEGVAEIAGSDISGTLTTVAAFVPLLLAGGILVIFLKPFGVTLSIALMVSLILSLTIVPLLFNIRPQQDPTHIHFMGAAVLDMIDAGLQAILLFFFRHKKFVLIIIIAISGIAGWFMLPQKFSPLPQVDEGAVLVEYIMPPGTSLKESNRLGEAMDRAALIVPGVSCVYRRTGSPGGTALIEGVNRGEILIKLKSRTTRRLSSEKITKILRASFSKFQGILFMYHQPTQEKIDESFSGMPAVFGVTIFGPELKTLGRISDRIEDILSRDSHFSNIINNTQHKISEVYIRLDSVKLAQFDVDSGEIFSLLKSCLNGLMVTRLIHQKEEIAILLRMDIQRPLNNIQQIKELPVLNRKGDYIPLSKVAEVRKETTPFLITHLQGQREVTLLAEVEGNLSAVAKRIKKRLSTLELPENYHIELTGQYRVIMEMIREFGFTLLMAVMIIYLIMVMQFRSWSQPLIILITIPFTLLGAELALFIRKQGIDSSVGMGMVTLAGIAVNNAIVLISYANGLIKSGKKKEPALLTAMSIRLRPILLTSFTTIFSLLPAVLGIGVGSKIFQPFAVTIIGGLTTGLLSSLILVPLLMVTF